MFNFVTYFGIYLALFCLNGVYYTATAQEHECARTCTVEEEPRQCVYNFTAEWYYTMSKACYDCPDVLEDCNREDCVPADGRKRAVVTINRQIPSPIIEVCYGDEVIVHLENEMMTDATTIHWHGMHQRNSPYMDGVPFVTQCNIQPGTTFTYDFIPDQKGTHFYHSHSGLQRADGMYGALIVRTPVEMDPHGRLYDFDLSEHVIIVIDWIGETSASKFLADYQSVGDNNPSGMLINGRGLYHGDDEAADIPYQRFHVQQGFRYRFRLINAGALSCPVQVSVDNHMLTVISTDGNDIEPVEAESFVSSPGERFDFIINANQEEGGVHWIRFKGLLACQTRSVYQLGVLQYENASDDDYPDSEPTYDEIIVEGLEINTIGVGMEETNLTLSMPLLRSIEDSGETLKADPDFKYVVGYAMYSVDNPMYHKENVYGYYNVTDANQRSLTPQLNHISMQFLSFPMLPGRNAIQPGMLCNESTIDMKQCEEEFCACPHVVQIPLGAVVEITLIDKSPFTSHPMHIHGTKFSVIGMEALDGTVTEERIEELDQAGMLLRNFDNPAIKDTVSVPGGGYAILRFTASNPGYWLAHCHLEFHAEVGMLLVFKIGEDDQMLNAPVGFPTCGDYE